MQIHVFCKPSIYWVIFLMCSVNVIWISETLVDHSRIIDFYGKFNPIVSNWSRLQSSCVLSVSFKNLPLNYFYFQNLKVCVSLRIKHIWFIACVTTWENVYCDMYVQRRLRSDCADLNRPFSFHLMICGELHVLILTQCWLITTFNCTMVSQASERIWVPSSICLTLVMPNELPHPLLSLSQSDYVIWIIAINQHS